LLPELTALENVILPAMVKDNLRTPATFEAKGRELLEQVGLAARSHHRPNQLSGGEQQRVAIARALINQPKIIFCDEPTGNLDSRTARGIHELFRELNETLRQTFVVVTHEESMAQAARHKVFLTDGVISGAHQPATG